MIFADLLNALVAPLNNDAYFADPASLVKWIAENRMDLLSELDSSLAKTGIGGVVAVSSVQDGERGSEIIVTILGQIHEIPLINRAPSGSKKTAFDVGVKALSIWGDRSWSPNRDVWSPLEFKGLELTDVDEEYGRVTWSLRMETRTMLEIVPTLLGDGGTKLFTDELGRPLLVSPINP
jgi:hypothetical protein